MTQKGNGGAWSKGPVVTLPLHSSRTRSHRCSRLHMDAPTALSVNSASLPLDGGRPTGHRDGRWSRPERRQQRPPCPALPCPRVLSCGCVDRCARHHPALRSSHCFSSLCVSTCHRLHPSDSDPPTQTRTATHRSLCVRPFGRCGLLVLPAACWAEAHRQLLGRCEEPALVRSAWSTPLAAARRRRRRGSRAPLPPPPRAPRRTITHG